MNKSLCLNTVDFKNAEIRFRYVTIGRGLIGLLDALKRYINYSKVW